MYINNMYDAFTGILEMSMIASVSIIIFLFLRPVLKKFPRIFSYLLWGIVLLRLLCPVSFQSSISILKLSSAPFMSVFFPASEAETVNEETFEYVILDEEVVLPEEKVTQTVVNGGMAEDSRDYLPVEVTKIPVYRWLLPVIWFIGIGVMMGYGVSSYISLKRKLIGAVEERDEIYSCDYIKTAFVLGFLFPRIYIPSDLEESKKEFVILHEQVHIRRKDFFFRLLAYLALAVHWFNPLAWVAFYLSGVDMEVSCDEAVMGKAKKDIRKEYAAALLEIATGKHILFAGFPAFGENQTKTRIQAVVNYKKKSMAALVAGFVLVVVLIIVLASDPKWDKESSSVSSTNTNKEVEEGRREAYVMTKIAMWTNAFSNRDGNTIVAMSTPENRKAFEEGMLLSGEEGNFSFGWSSPWPVFETDVWLKNLEENQATILYYARTSDPHVMVWAEYLGFEMGEDFETEDNFRVTSSEILFLDNIDDAVEFVLAYGEGINNTPMDYLTNGLGEVLNQNAKDNRYKDGYKELFSPDTAAIALLNLDSEKVTVDVSEGRMEEEVVIALMFEDSEQNTILQGIKMVQPFGPNGIWIPQNYEDSVFMEDGVNYRSAYDYWKRKLGENFLEEFYEKIYTIESDISRDGIDETIEVYTGDGGDGDSGFVCIKDIHGSLLFHEYAQHARVGWNTVFLSEDDFLINVHMDDRDTYGEYSYEVYRVVGENEIQILAKDSFSFDFEREAVDSQQVMKFFDTLYLYLERSRLLLTTQGGELKAIGMTEENMALEDLMESWYLPKKIIESTSLVPANQNS